jgi:chaperonin GroES
MAKTASKTASIPLTPLSDKVLIKPLSEVEMGTKSASGIIIPDTVSDKVDRGTVVAVGPGRWNEDGDGRVAMNVKVGDRVIFQWGDKLEFGGEEYYLVSESNISAIINQ